MLSTVVGLLATALPAGASPTTSVGAADDGQVTAAVVNGTTASYADWPYVVGLLDHRIASPADGQYCTGSVVAAAWVMTAAHCVVGRTPGDIDVFGGAASLLAVGPAVKRLAVAQLVVHPGYDPVTGRNDVALVRTAVPTGLPAVALAGTGPVPADPTMGWVAGYGCVASAPGGCQGYAVQLQQASVPVYDDADCAAAYATLGFAFNPDVELCSGWWSTNGTGPDACSGDSGGPLVGVDAAGHDVLVGVVNRGGVPCGYVGGIDADVAVHAAWWGPVLGLAGGPAAPPQVLPGGVIATGRFVPLPPTRVVDTRTGLGGFGARPLPAGGGIEVALAGRSGVPADASAVVVNLTVTEAAAPGWVQVLPAGDGGVGTSSTLNVEQAGQTVANMAMVALGRNGAVGVHTQSGAHVVLDVLGYVTPVPEPQAVAAGRYVAQAPLRALDTRAGLGTPAGLVPAGGRVRVSLPGVPADATAVVVNLTATEALADGFVQALPAGSGAAGTSSNLNVTVGRTVANLAVVPVVGGAIDLYTQSPTHLLVDVAGFFTGESAPASRHGLFVPVSPTRVVDTRSGVRLDAGSAVDIDPAIAIGAVPGGIGAVVVNLTATEATSVGFVQALPTGRAVQGSSSNLNVDRDGQTVANAVMTALGDGGRFSLYAQAGTQLLADVTGYFTA